MALKGDLSKKLTASEEQILLLIAQGLSTKEIAQQIGISPHTAAVHRTNLMRKLGLHSIAQTIHWAIQTGRFSLEMSRENPEKREA